MAQSKFVPHDLKKSVIRIFDYSEMNIAGVISNPFYEKEQSFKSTTQLLKMLDQLQDDINFPEKSMDPRSFTKNSREVFRPESELQADGKCLASFEISILFRHNASWQGSVIWLEKAASAEFRSVLELIFLIDSVLSEVEGNS